MKSHSVAGKSPTPFNQGLDYLSQCRPQDALECFVRAESEGVDADDCAAQRWYCWMLLGDFESAWRESDAIAGRNASGSNCFWDGRSFDGKRVIVRSLHGYGDAIQFMRYVPMLRSRARRVIVETHPDLVSLIRGQAGVDEAIPWSDTKEWDQQIEVMEFPRAFRTTIASIPHRVPYLHVPDESSGMFSRMFAGYERPRVGIVWGAGDWDRSRSLPVQLVAPILEVPGVSFFSFQHGRYRCELSNLQRAAKIEDTAAYCPEIADTAAALMHMDLLITVDTMAAHLAGALGIKVWTLLQWRADWRWMLNREDSPWYPTMRLFRQAEPGRWQDLVLRMVTMLKAGVL